MQKKTIRVGGVPEHFNYPWHKALAENSFAKAGMDLEWKDYPGGTGAMVKDLRAKELDLAVVLTEGIVSDIVKGNEAIILQQFIKSPLVWGIHIAANARFKYIEEIENARYAISRKGSGSHIMAFVDARNRGWDCSKIKFVEVGNFEGALRAFENDEADLIFWEKYTTLPYVESGQLRRLGECVTPWPCFMVAGRTEFVNANKSIVDKCLQALRFSCRDFMNDVNAINIIAQNYNLPIEAAYSWFYQTEWALNRELTKKSLSNVLHTLKEVNVIDHLVEVESLCDKNVKLLA